MITYIKLDTDTPDEVVVTFASDAVMESTTMTKEKFIELVVGNPK